MTGVKSIMDGVEAETVGNVRRLADALPFVTLLPASEATPQFGVWVEAGYEVLTVHIDAPEFRAMASRVFALDAYDAECVEDTEAYSVDGGSWAWDDEGGEPVEDVAGLAGDIDRAVTEGGADFSWITREDATEEQKACSDALYYVLHNKRFIDNAVLRIAA